MKKIIFAAIISLFAFQVFAADPLVNEKVLTAFNKTFQRATDIRWSELPEAYEVSFKQDEIFTRVTYDKQGNIERTLRAYYEEQLPIMVLSKVKARFAGKKIFGVIEESSQDGTYYHITLEDEKHWFNIKADSMGTLTVEKKFRKA
jgi:hypothetical protein